MRKTTLKLESSNFCILICYVINFNLYNLIFNNSSLKNGLQNFWKFHNGLSQALMNQLQHSTAHEPLVSPKHLYTHNTLPGLLGTFLGFSTESLTFQDTGTFGYPNPWTIQNSYVTA